MEEAHIMIWALSENFCFRTLSCMWLTQQDRTSTVSSQLSMPSTSMGENLSEQTDVNLFTPGMSSSTPSTTRKASRWCRYCLHLRQRFWRSAGVVRQDCRSGWKPKGACCSRGQQERPRGEECKMVYNILTFACFFCPEAFPPYDDQHSPFQSERAVTLEEGEKFAKEINAVFLETSAKDNLCVNDLFQVGRPQTIDAREIMWIEVANIDLSDIEIIVSEHCGADRNSERKHGSWGGQEILLNILILFL